MAKAFSDLAKSINEEDGFLWKIWAESPETNEAGGIYMLWFPPINPHLTCESNNKLKPLLRYTFIPALQSVVCGSGRNT
ncbi:hypothetical protein J2T13_001308 [Paenibacillus sp. DS2015]